MNVKTKILKEGVGYKGTEEMFEKNYALSKFLKDYANDVVSEGTEETFNKYYLLMNPIGRKLVRNLRENDEYVRRLATVEKPLLFEGYLTEDEVGDKISQSVQKAIDKSVYQQSPNANLLFDFQGMKTPEEIQKAFDQKMIEYGNTRIDKLTKIFNQGIVPMGYKREIIPQIDYSQAGTSAALVGLAKENSTVAAALMKENPTLGKALKKTVSEHPVAQQGFMGWLTSVWNNFNDFIKHLFTDPIKTLTGSATNFGTWVQHNPLTFGALAAIPAGIFILSRIRKGKKNEVKSVPQTA